MTSINTSLENKERFRQLPIYDLLRNIKVEHGNGDIKHLVKCILSNLKTTASNEFEATFDNVQIPFSLSATTNNTTTIENSTDNSATKDCDINSAVHMVTFENVTKKSTSKEYHPDHNDHETEGMNLSGLDLPFESGHGHGTVEGEIASEEESTKARTASILTEEDKATLEQIDSMKLCGDMAGE